MVTTRICAIANDSPYTLHFTNGEHADVRYPSISPYDSVIFPDDKVPTVPWGKSGKFWDYSFPGDTHRLEIDFQESPRSRCYIWQSDESGTGDRIRVAAYTGSSQAPPIFGDSASGGDKGLVIQKDGTLRIFDWQKAGIPQRTEFQAIGSLGEGRHAVQYETSQRSGAVLKRTELSYKRPTEQPYWQVIQVDPEQDQVGQTIQGFGGAFTDATLANLKKRTSALRQKILQLYFGEHGIGYSYARIPMGSNDFSDDYYTYSNVKNDFDLKHFQLEPNDYERIEIIKEANQIRQAIGLPALKLLASAWTAPPWMKEGEQWVGGQLKADERYYQTWALYFVKFLQQYHAHDLDIWGVTVQNEPSGAPKTGLSATAVEMERQVSAVIPHVLWESMYFTVDDQAKFIGQYLGPQLHHNYPHVKILCYEDQKYNVKGWTDQGFMPEDVINILKSYGASDYVDGIAFHWYQKAMKAAWHNDPWCQKALDETYKNLKDNGWEDKFLFATEACQGFERFDIQRYNIGHQGPSPHSDIKWKRATEYASDIITDLNNWTVGWLDWNLVLNLEGGPNHAKNRCTAPILCDSDENFYIQPMFYYLAHFSKFITPGSVKVKTESTYREGEARKNPLEVTAFKTTRGDVVVVVQNVHPQQSCSYCLDIAHRGCLELDIEHHAIQTLVIPAVS